MREQLACEWRDVWVYYGRLAALQGVSLEVRRGEVVGLFGHNGAGKSTLLKVLLGLTPLQRGQVLVDGEVMNSDRLREFRRRVGYVPQMLRPEENLPVSAWEVVMTSQWARIGWGRLPQAQHRQAVADALQQVGALHLANKPFGQLSGGEQQRVLLARALASSPSLLLMDEPTSSLDWHLTQELVRLVRQAHESNNLTTIVVSHDTLFLKHLCDRVAVIERGRVVTVLRASHLLGYMEEQGWQQY